MGVLTSSLGFPVMQLSMAITVPAGTFIPSISSASLSWFWVDFRTTCGVLRFEVVSFHCLNLFDSLGTPVRDPGGTDQIHRLQVEKVLDSGHDFGDAHHMVFAVAPVLRPGRRGVSGFLSLTNQQWNLNSVCVLMVK